MADHKADPQIPSDKQSSGNQSSATSTPKQNTDPNTEHGVEQSAEHSAGERALGSALSSTEPNAKSGVKSDTTSGEQADSTPNDYLRNPQKKESSLIWVPQQSSDDFVVPGTPRKSDASAPENANNAHQPEHRESLENEQGEKKSASETSTDTTEEHDVTSSAHTQQDEDRPDGSLANDSENSSRDPEDTQNYDDQGGDNSVEDDTHSDTDNEGDEGDEDDDFDEDGEDGEDGEEDEEEEEDDDEDDDEEEEGPTTLREHLLDLRRRVFFMFVWAIAGFALCFPFATEIFNHLMNPMIDAMDTAMKQVPTAEGSDVIQLFMEPMINALTQAVQSNSATAMADAYAYLIHPMMDTMMHAVKGFEATHTSATLIYTAPSEAFFTEMKVAFVAGLFVMSPLIFYQVWLFIAPGLYREEKIVLIPLAFSSGFFFVAGGAFCYFVAFPTVFKFFMSYNSASITAMPSLKESLSFALQFMVAFGVVFEMPLFTFFLARLGIVTGKMLRSFWRYSILIILLVAAVLTPPDVISQCLMAGPMLILYGISIIIADIFGKKTAPEEEESDEDDASEDDGPQDDNDSDTEEDEEGDDKDAQAPPHEPQDVSQDNENSHGPNASDTPNASHGNTITDGDGASHNNESNGDSHSDTVDNKADALDESEGAPSKNTPNDEGNEKE